jgi:Flp pilus assembly protein TadG
MSGSLSHLANPSRLPSQAQRGRSQRGAALVEFALIFPLLAVLLFGTVSGGLVLNRRIEVTHAGREAARYGATVAPEQCTPTSNCGNRTWAQHVRHIAVQRSDGAVTAANVCVALVEGPGNNPRPLSLSHTTRATLAPCYIDDSADIGRRVQVQITYNDQIDAALFRVPVNSTTRTTSKLEQ